MPRSKFIFLASGGSSTFAKVSWGFGNPFSTSKFVFVGKL
ncbi:hypothetical protein SLEP1_g22922 [Rubroshorea leprosula]|uniref:Ribosomal protein L32 n=1 Tax=Rubroshorea leprosula TaxID=152421 RepID=A0AAV5JAP9_9ROSI|nr:hypothetical protein SLEP1_g22922 [Rubroshorea leprosula]